MKLKFSGIVPSVGLLAALLAAPAHAQDTAASASSDESSDEIVVTGTSIRGVAPAGAPSINLDQQQITATSSVSTVQLLTTLPQINQFNEAVSVTDLGVRQTTIRPAIHNISAGTSGSSPTLILMDGHRLAGAGITQTSPDPDVVPPGALARVEVVTDGGSSIYGSDAIGGVINFITRKDFDGFEANVRQGFGDEFQSNDSYFTAGKSWEGGNAYLTYNYSQHDAIYGRDRDYVRNISWDTSEPANATTGGTPYLLPTARGCTPGNLTLNQAAGIGALYNINNSGGVTSFTSGTNASVRCETADNTAIYPQERRDSILGGLSQDLTNTLHFDLRAWYTHRVTKNDQGPNLNIGANPNANITALNNDFFQSITGVAGERQRVFYNFADVPGIDTIARTSMETWGFSPSFTLDLGRDWQARAFFNYGDTLTTLHDPQISASVITANFRHINFYDLGATDPQYFAGLQNATIRASGENQIVNGRTVFDGPLFSLPGGEVRMAVGAEYLGDTFSNEQSSGGPPVSSDSRRSHAVFAEFNVPIVGEGNRLPLVYALSLSLSERRDTYSDFGSANTPRIGLTYQPVDWINLRGAWGKSFKAPSLADTAVGNASPQTFPLSILLGFVPSGEFPFTPVGSTTDQNILAVLGARSDLRAEQAKTYSFGFDISPPIVSGLTLSATYYNVNYTDQIGPVPVTTPGFFPNNPCGLNSVVMCHADGSALSDGEIETFFTSRGLPLSQVQSVYTFAGHDPATLLVDFRTQNLAALVTDGIDVSARYDHDMPFGSVYFNLTGNYQISTKIDFGTGFGKNIAPIGGGDGRTPRWGTTTTVGARVGENFLGQVTWIHIPSVPVTPSAANSQQTELAPFGTFNAYFQYDLHGSGFEKDVTLSLGVNNIFDADPRSFHGANGYQGSTLGRVVTLGLNKRF